MYLEAEVWTVAKTDKGNAVMVRPISSEMVVPIFIGSLEAQNILLGLGDIKIPRPMTHDLMMDLLRSLSGEVAQIEIHTLTEGTFYASIIISSAHLGRITLDARPSDALALAVRSGCPIYIEESIVEESGVPLKNIEEMDEDAETPFPEPPEDLASSPVSSKRQELEMLLEQLVIEEKYEEAAKVRDELKNL